MVLGQMNRIDVLPDDVLQGIFDFYTGEYLRFPGKRNVEAWQSLVHVCRRWRSIVLGSPRRLNLQLYCTPRTPARKTLDVWPALPLHVVGGVAGGNVAFSSGMDDIIAALGQSSRVCQVKLLGLAGLHLENVSAAMQAPFPELTVLWLSLHGETSPVISDSFLGESAPRLRYVTLDGIPYPGLPKALLSANHLVDLVLSNIPHSGYFSPEAMVASLSVISRLESLSLEFRSPQPRPDWETRRSPPPKRFILPTLENLIFKGVTEYLEILVTFVDAPRLAHFQITFFNQIDFDIPRLSQFINRTPPLRNRDEAHVQFDDRSAGILFGTLQISVLCREPDWQVSSIEQVCSSSLHPASTVEYLYIERRHLPLVWKEDAIEDTLWLQLLFPFIRVKNLYLSKEFAPIIAAALQELVGGGITEVLPGLQNIFIEQLRVEPSGPFLKSLEQFAAMRQLSNHPVTISDWV